MIKTLLPLLAGGLAVIASPAAAQPQRATGEAQLARALEGRVAGEPVNCLDTRSIRSSRIINDTAILYEVGSTIYVNRPRNGADSLNRWDTQVTRPMNGRLCSVDTVRMIDASSGFMTGLVFLGDFVPYRRPERD